jgi:serine phosphatase RsbU (regulator of sigma subunit)
VAESPDASPNPYLADYPERDVTTPSGVRLTMMNPAYMTRQVHELAEKAYGVQGHITSANPIRRENAPDEWEAEALGLLAASEGEISSIEEMGGQEYMRLMRRLITEPSCLSCHSAQGYRVGDVRGGISVATPMAPLQAVAQGYKVSLAFGHGLVCIVGILGILLGGNRLQASHHVIEVQNTELADRNRQPQDAYGQLDREFRTVGEVQVSLLPKKPPEIAGFEIATYYDPATQAGGDYFDFFALPEGRWGLIVADVSGHGVPAAVVMAMTRVILHVSKCLTPCDETLARLNADLLANLTRGEFVTACYGVLDPSDATFTFASAGHPSPLCIGPDRGQAIALEVEPGFPLGMVAEASYPATTLNLARNQAVVIYTDGITEAMDAEHQVFGQSRLLDALQCSEGGSAGAMKDRALEALDRHRGPVELEDDVTLLIMRVLGR